MGKAHALSFVLVRGAVPYPDSGYFAGNVTFCSLRR
jgi:hypothetical protein